MAIAKTVAEQIENLVNPKPENDHRDLKIRILKELPQDIKPPVLSNIGSKYGGVKAWCSFTCPSYDPSNSHDPIAIARSLENAGWTIQPASLAKYGDYRKSVYRGLPNELDQESSRAKLKEAEEILPVWIRPQQYTAADAYFFMKTPNGLFIKITIDVPRCGIAIYARRVETFGGWYFERGTGRMSFPTEMNTMFGGVLSAKCYVDTDQGISGEMYWKKASINLTASEILAKLLNK